MHARARTHICVYIKFCVRPLYNDQYQITGDDHIYQVINAGCADKDLAHFDEQLGLFGGDVHMDVQWDNRGLFALQGPKAKNVMQRLIGDQLDLATVGFGQCFTADVANVPVFFSRCGYTGEDVSNMFWYALD